MTSKERAVKQLYKTCSSIITEKTQEIHRLVKGQGSLDSKVVFISYMPSDVEEEEALTFYGDLGKRFDEVLSSIGLSTSDIYVTQMIKYKPYKINERTGRIIKREVSEDEKQFFMDNMIKELEIIQPEFIVPMGEDVLKMFMEDEHIQLEQTKGKLLTKNHGLKKYKLIPMSHPASKDTTLEKDIEIIRTLWDHVNRKEKEAISKSILNDAYTIAPKRKEMKKVAKEKTEEDNRLKIIVVYGGTGLTDDPTMEVVNRIGMVFTELNVNMIRMDINKDYNIQEFLHEMETADGLVLSTTVTWIGIGGRLQMFLDECYQFGRQESFKNCYLLGVVISKQMYERDAYNHLLKSWEILGGMEGTSICASIRNVVAFETDSALCRSVDKKAEEFYRILHQQRTPLPSSIRSNKLILEVESPVESETKDQIEHEKDMPKSLIPNYDEYIAKQKQDIEEISNLFKKKVSHTQQEGVKDEPSRFLSTYKGESELITSIQWLIDDRPMKHFHMLFNEDKFRCQYGEEREVNVYINLEYDILRKILNGKLTIQRAFMTGKIKVKGDFSVLYELDKLFDLEQ